MGRESWRTRCGWTMVSVVFVAVICFAPAAHAGWDLPGPFGTLTSTVDTIYGYATNIPGIVANVGSLSIKLTTGFADVLGGVVTIDNLVGAVTEPGSLFGLFQEVLDGLKDLVEEQFSAAFSLVEDLSAGMLEYLEELGEDLTLDFEVIGTMIGNLTGDLIKSIADVGGDLVGGIGDVVGDLGDIDGMITRSFDSLGISVFDDFASADGLIGGMVTGQIASLEAVATSLAGLATDPEKIADIFLSLAELGVVMSIMPMEQALALQEARLEQMCAVIETLPLVLETLPDLVSGLQETHDGYLDRVVEFAGNLPEWLSSIPDLVEGKLRGAADSLASDITQLAGFIPGMEGINAALGASDRTMADMLSNLTALADSIEQGFAQLEQQLAVSGVSDYARDVPDSEFAVRRAGLEAELAQIEQENRRLDADNQRLYAARRADAWAVVMAAIQRDTSIPALASVDGASGGDAT